MGRLYVGSFENVAVTAAQDFFEIAPASNKPIQIHGYGLHQTTDLGDAAEEILRISLVRGHTTSGSGGSTMTPALLNSSADTAAGDTTIEINNTTIASTAGTTLYVHGMNIRAGLEVWFPPEARPGVSAADTTVVLRLLAAPADSLTMGGWIVFEEMI